MEDINELLDIYFCECGRPYCDFFNPNGDSGTSMSIEEIKEILKQLRSNNIEKIRKHLKSELNKFSKRWGKHLVETDKYKN